jgi:hypothetical protein
MVFSNRQSFFEEVAQDMGLIRINQLDMVLNAILGVSR